MTLLNALVASSAIALGVLISSAAPASALVAQDGHGNGVSPNHNGMMKRLVNPAHACGDNAKVGIAWGPNIPSNYITNAISSKACWYYNWSSFPAESSFAGGLKFVPMLQHDISGTVFRSEVIDRSTHYGIALAMSEVDQSKISPKVGVNMWNEYMVPLKQRGYSVISPSVTSAPSGIPWMKEWINGGLDEGPDALALQWYGKSFNDFRDYVDSFVEEFPLMDLWITASACTDLDGGNCDAMAFANQAIPYLDQTLQIKAYFPFAFGKTMSNVGEASRLMDGDGILTDLGRRYLQ